MNKRRIKRDDYIDKLKEWQENQYNPGYYTGGKIPPIMTHTGKPKLLGLFMMISSIVVGVITTIFFIKIFILRDIIQISLFAIFLYGLNIVNFIAGLRLIKKGTSEKTYKKLKKKFLNISSIILITVTLVFSINAIFLEKESFIMVSNVNDVEIIQEKYNNYVILNNGKLVLDSDSFYLIADIWKVKVTKGNESIKIYYKWNVLNPNHGKVKKVEVLD